MSPATTDGSMPSSPKLHHPRSASRRFRSPIRRLSSSFTSILRRFTSSAAFLPVSFLLFAVAGFLLGSLSRSTDTGPRSPDFEPTSVSVKWDCVGGDSGGGGALNKDGVLGGGSIERHKVMGFVGVQTGFASVLRRWSLRKTWFPSNHQSLLSLEESTGLAFRFVIGKTKDRIKMEALRREIEKYDDFMLLDIEEEYSKLPIKTLAFFKAAFTLFDADFYVKADDDIYLRPDRLSLLLAKDRSHPQTYLGCMKKGPVFTDPKLKWYEPLSNLLGNEYFLHAYGPIYALSSEVVARLVALRNNSYRMFSNEDVTIGSWMLSMNVNYENNHALCAPDCTPSSIAVWDIPTCSGLCKPEARMLQLHQRESCSGSRNL